MHSEPRTAAARLNRLLEDASLAALDRELAARFEDYLALLLRWNARVNLTSIRDPDQVLARHFVESIACARALPAGIRTLLDFGSGAGFPGLPIALLRPEIAVTLAESQAKKAAFLRETVRVLGMATRVHAGRAERLGEQFDCVTLRAVDRMPEAVSQAARLVSRIGWLALMTTQADLGGLKAVAGADFRWNPPIRIPGGDERVVCVGQRQSEGD
jgi:16S rRNA (guanine527-N7)-methyltransferase